MTESVLQKSKILCYFKIDKTLGNISEELLIPVPLPLTLYHFHYPSLYFPILHRHFALHIPPKYTPNHLCLRHKGRELSAELPLGLQVDDGDEIEVGVREQPVPDGFTMVKISWKKGYSIVNREGGCDHVFKKIDEDERKRLYHLHLGGHTHELHKYPKYEGNCIAIKIYSEGQLIQRKEDQLHWTVSEYFANRFKGTFKLKKCVWTHGVLLDQSITLKQLLENWNYNDGYCYLKVKI